MARADGALTRQYVKLCDRRDFDNPVLRAKMREVVPSREPAEEVERKLWEYAMLALFLEDVGRLREDTRVLAIGAGHEQVLYWLANRVGHVMATDIYGEGDFAGREADETMLADPSAFAPYAYREDRLEARHMDARRLEFPEHTFDVVFSLSSIEHFGAPRDIVRSAREMGRVLKPGGHAFVATECFLEYRWLDRAPVHFALRVGTLGRRARPATLRRRAIDVFTPAEIESRIVRPSGLALMQVLDRTVSPETFENVTVLNAEGRCESMSGRYWPHIVVRAPHASPWTSVALALEKR